MCSVLEMVTRQWETTRNVTDRGAGGISEGKREGGKEGEREKGRERERERERGGEREREKKKNSE